MVVEKCRSCGSGIIWAITQTGKRIPVDADPTPDGSVRLVDEDGTVYARVRNKNHAKDPTGTTLRTSHFATCPHAADWRKR